MEFVLLPLALLGHGFLWAGFFNHTHGSGLPRWFLKPITVVALVLTGFLPIAFGMWLWSGDFDDLFLAPPGPVVWFARLYLPLCWLAGVMAIFRWLAFQVLRRPPAVLRHNRSRLVQLLPASPGPCHFLTRLPGNQILELDVAERAIEVPRLPEALDRFSILHLSDFHFTGRVDKAYFEEIVRLANGLEPDLVALTGDFVDKPHAIDWVADTFGRLTARCGVYFILGNHDLWCDTGRLCRALADAGLIDLGGRWMEVQLRGEPVVLAGNLLPWIAPAADLQNAPPRSPHGGPLRVALCHSPDQLAWGRAADVDLLLAGHTHGGQIRLPLVGPILSATHAGIRYSSGLFHAPPTIMHVSRGVSAEVPVRFNCPPEITKLVLQTPLRPSA